ncbi:hypothetical protein Golax_000259, partial [Gossypium laxum]|nr:hypothetical protein [Gossypium laxum]
ASNIYAYLSYYETKVNWFYCPNIRFADKQIVRLQETPDEIPEGGTPHTVSLLMHDKLVDAGKPGDRVEVTGIYRAMSVRVGPTQRTVKSLFKACVL